MHSYIRTSVRISTVPCRTRAAASTPHSGSPRRKPSSPGFVAVQLDHEASIGQIYMIAVDPNYQRDGVAARLTESALDWIRQAGMAVAMVETGGDAGHAPARQLYEHTGFTQLPLARYFKKL